MANVRLLLDGHSVGAVSLANGNLVFEVEDDRERDELQSLFAQTGEVTYGWTQVGEGEVKSHRAGAFESEWFWFVVAVVLYPQGYRIESAEY
jgi:hypothetical protein